MSTRQRILSAAVQAFNEQGSHAVTTNDLADLLGMSIGNLYYHFRSKEEIIRAAFDLLNDAWRTRLCVPDPARPLWPDIESLITEHFIVLWEFRFFYREQVALRQRDPLLARRWKIAHHRGRDDMAGLLTALCATCPHPCTPTNDQLQHITDVCWVLADYWMPFMESRNGPLRKSELAAGVTFFRRGVLPLLHCIGWQASARTEVLAHG